MGESKLMVVDDEPDLRATLALRYEARGYAVSTASDGDAALELFRDRRPDLTLVDVHMPRVDGLSTIRAMFEVDPEATIVAMSGDISAERSRTIIEAGAAEVVMKPLDFEALDELVDDLMTVNLVRAPNASR